MFCLYPRRTTRDQLLLSTERNRRLERILEGENSINNLNQSEGDSFILLILGLFPPNLSGARATAARRAVVISRGSTSYGYVRKILPV
jgi:hypothetical protein